MHHPPLFRSPFLAGFECSSHRRWDGRRLDLIASTDHDARARHDYRQIAEHGLRTARDGVRWHRVETAPGAYDWSSFLPMLRAANDAGVQVIWDLCHYGWPDDLDIWSPLFVDRFARFSAAAARVVRDETGEAPFYCPVNEISFWAWAGGEVGRFNPACHGRGGELKRQLVRAAIASIEAIRAVDPRARFITAEPIINVQPASERADDMEHARLYRRAQFEALDMIAGTLAPELGGRPDYVDIVGVNFYPDNQWVLGGGTIPFGHHAYMPFRDLLAEAFVRYRRPLLVAETGAEGSAKAAWLAYVCAEVRAARARGMPVEGVCLYPVLDYPGWDNDRTCAVGLFCGLETEERRTVDAALADELARQQALFTETIAEPSVRLRRVAEGA